MMIRNIIRRISLLTYNCCTTANVHRPVKHTIPFARSHTTAFSSHQIKPRFYSQQTNVENLPVVDFNYVKRATSQNEVMIIDVREPDEIKEHGKIPNSLNIPLASINATLMLTEQDFEQTFNRPKPKENTEIIFYCMIGKRSGKAQQSALNIGFKNAKNYMGSWTDWATKTQSVTI